MNFAYSLTENSRRYPDKVAIVDGPIRLTYSEFDGRVSSIAAWLLRAGAHRGWIVGILMWNCAEFLEVYYACMRIGAVCLPLNYRMSADELRYELEHSRCDILFTEERFHETVGRVAPDVPTLVRIVTTAETAPADWWRHAELNADRGVSVPDEVAGTDDVQRIMYTSGTTARPRAAQITHGQVHWGALTRLSDFGLSRDDVNLTVGPLYHVGALDTFATAMLFVGGTVVIHERFDAAEVLTALEREGITNCWMAPTMVNMIFGLPEVADRDTSALRVLVMGGEKTPLPLLQRVFAQWKGVGVYDAYGLTECQGLATALPTEFAISKIGSVGVPCRGREIRLVDEVGVEVPVGEPGEVLVRGPVVFPGYFDDPQATAAALEDGWLHTGDMAVRDADGFLYIVDRKKDMIRSGGENIAASEVERVLHELAEVLEVAVVAMPDPRWIEVPAAFLVLKPGREIAPDVVIAHCRAKLAGFKVPKHVSVIPELPRTPSGKVMKRELRTLFTQAATAG